MVRIDLFGGGRERQAQSQSYYRNTPTNGKRGGSNLRESFVVVVVVVLVTDSGGPEPERKPKREREPKGPDDDRPRHKQPRFADSVSKTVGPGASNPERKRYDDCERKCECECNHNRECKDETTPCESGKLLFVVRYTYV